VVVVVVIMTLIMMTMITKTTIIMHTYEDRMEILCTEVQDTKGPVPEQTPGYQEE
jgi:hypothetical protein